MSQSPLEFRREPSHRCGVTLMDTQVGRAVANSMLDRPGVIVTHLESMVRIDAGARLEFEFAELADVVGEEFDQNAFEQILSTHYGRMVALDDRMIVFADPEDAAHHLGFDLGQET
jgi:propane monooxygenase coupling protein